jgi:hypothetical protein
MTKQVYDNVRKLLNELTELNVRTLNNWPNNIASLEEAIDYTKQINNIWIRAIEQGNKIVDDMLHGTKEPH